MNLQQERWTRHYFLNTIQKNEIHFFESAIGSNKTKKQNETKNTNKHLGAGALNGMINLAGI